MSEYVFPSLFLFRAVNWCIWGNENILLLEYRLVIDAPWIFQRGVVFLWVLLFTTVMIMLCWNWEWKRKVRALESMHVYSQRFWVLGISMSFKFLWRLRNWCAVSLYRFCLSFCSLLISDDVHPGWLVQTTQITKMHEMKDKGLIKLAIS